MLASSRHCHRSYVLRAQQHLNRLSSVLTPHSKESSHPTHQRTCFLLKCCCQRPSMPVVAIGNTLPRDGTQVPSSHKRKLKAVLLLLSSSFCGLGEWLSHTILPGKTALKLYAPVSSGKTYAVCSGKVSAGVKEDNCEWFECADFQGLLKI